MERRNGEIRGFPGAHPVECRRDVLAGSAKALLAEVVRRAARVQQLEGLVRVPRQGADTDSKVVLIQFAAPQFAPMAVAPQNAHALTGVDILAPGQAHAEPLSRHRLPVLHPGIRDVALGNATTPGKHPLHGSGGHAAFLRQYVKVFALPFGFERQRFGHFEVARPRAENAGDMRRACMGAGPTHHGVGSPPSPSGSACPSSTTR